MLIADSDVGAMREWVAVHDGDAGASDERDAIIDAGFAVADANLNVTCNFLWLMLISFPALTAGMIHFLI